MTGKNEWALIAAGQGQTQPSWMSMRGTSLFASSYPASFFPKFRSFALVCCSLQLALLSHFLVARATTNCRYSCPVQRSRWEISAADRSRDWHWNLAPFTPCLRGAMWWRFFFWFLALFLALLGVWHHWNLAWSKPGESPFYTCLNDHWAVFGCGDRTRQSRHFRRSLVGVFRGSYQPVFNSFSRKLSNFCRRGLQL